MRVVVLWFPLCCLNVFKYCAGATARLPLWLAPNLITMIGLAGLVLAYIVAFIYLPSFEGLELCVEVSRGWYKPSYLFPCELPQQAG